MMVPLPNKGKDLGCPILILEGRAVPKSPFSLASCMTVKYEYNINIINLYYLFMEFVWMNLNFDNMMITICRCSSE